MQLLRVFKGFTYSRQDCVWCKKCTNEKETPSGAKAYFDEMYQLICVGALK